MWRPLSAAAAALAILLGVATAAQAAPAPPAPDSGTGGTAVTVSLTPPNSYARVVGGYGSSIGMTADGQVWAWGNNAYGQLGDGTLTQRTTPVLVKMPAGVTSFTQISPDQDYTLALGNDGKAYAWGRNNYGQLGDGTTTDRTTPVAITMPAGVTAFSEISTGIRFSIALGDDGKLYAWGYNGNGELGDGTKTNRATPAAVTMPTGVTAFTQMGAGGSHVVAIGNDGKTYAWGFNGAGQVGDGTQTGRTTPVAVKMPSGVTAFNQIWAQGSRTIALGNNSKLYAWGANSVGELGNGTTSVYRASPVAVTMPTGVTSFTHLSIGGAHSLALGNDGKFYAWGDNTQGQFGNGSTTNRSRPTAVTMPSAITSSTQLIAGGSHSLAIGNDGKTYTWGLNVWGQLGDGTTTRKLTPTAMPQQTVAVTGVTFDGVAGTGLTKLTDSTWQVIAPPRSTSGPVEVAVNWTLSGVAQTPFTYADGFTYIGPKVEVTTRAYRDAARTIEIPRGGVLTTGMTIYWKYTVKNTGLVPISITQLKRDGQVLTLTTVCPAREIAVSQTVTCTAQSTV